MEKTYKVNEIFYSLQGEGRWAGTAAIFIRFSGCNLKCPFCDTDFRQYKKMTLSQIIQVIEYWEQCRFIVLTGGEPTLQVENDFIDALHEQGYYVAMETNGTRDIPSHVDWSTVSPKQAYVENGKTWVSTANEVKVVCDEDHNPDTHGIEAQYYYVQPCDTGDAKRNANIIRKCVEWVEQNPKWKLSLQQQKILNVR